MSSTDSQPSAVGGGHGQVFVCTNKYCRDKGSDATMATFTFLTPSTIPVVAVNCLGRCNKGPNVRVLTPQGGFVEATMVRSVEKVVELLQSTLHIDINMTSADVLRLNYEGNIYLRSGEVDQAIECYDKALSLGDKEQEGVLLVMRGTALLQRAYACRLRYKDIANVAQVILPSYEMLVKVLEMLSTSSSNQHVVLELLQRVNGLYQQLDQSPRWAEGKAMWPEPREGSIPTTINDLLGKMILTWSLYENALLRALQDLLTATVLLPGFAQAWRRAGDALAESQKLRSAIEYYEVALQLEPELSEVVVPVISRLHVLERLEEKAEALGWPSEMVQALLDD
eukprot:scaffold1016_cov175-Ochromonas_danica.AAC.10